MYTCGITPYNTPHIGNYKAYIFADILRRTLESNNYTVKQVINLTDVDDKTIKKSIELNTSLFELTKKYEDEFYKDRKDLILLPPEYSPRATDYIPKMIEIIEILIEKGFAYTTPDGSVYFSVKSDKDYGKLIDFKPEDLKTNADGRMNNADEYEKDDVQDFALWKSWDINDGPNKWDSPWGPGRPGWHIECSAMAREFIGEIVDIHTGGIDNMFPHHENEIAQSECAYGHEFARFFVHCNHLMIDGKKMAKRDGNFFTLKDLKQKGVHPLSFKYFLYGTHYRSPANMTWDGLLGSQTTLKRMYEKYISIINNKLGEVDNTYVQKIKDSLNNDLNTAEGVSIFIKLFDDNAVMNSVKISTINEIDKILALVSMNIIN